MKILTITLTLFLFNNYCMAVGAPLIRVDKSRIESIALKSIRKSTALQIIRKQHPKMKSETLAFDGIEYTMTAKGSEIINVTYTLPALTKSKIKTMGSYTNQVQYLQTVEVELSNDGKVVNVLPGRRTSYSPLKK